MNETTEAAIQRGIDSHEAELRRRGQCPGCKGTGEGDAGDCPCAECHGTGKWAGSIHDPSYQPKE